MFFFSLHMSPVEHIEGKLCTLRESTQQMVAEENTYYIYIER